MSHICQREGQRYWLELSGALQAGCGTPHEPNCPQEPLRQRLLASTQLQAAPCLFCGHTRVIWAAV